MLLYAAGFASDVGDQGHPGWGDKDRLGMRDNPGALRELQQKDVGLLSEHQCQRTSMMSRQGRAVYMLGPAFSKKAGNG
jgi:hypothetical protein